MPKKKTKEQKSVKKKPSVAKSSSKPKSKAKAKTTPHKTQKTSKTKSPHKKAAKSKVSSPSPKPKKAPKSVSHKTSSSNSRSTTSTKSTSAITPKSHTTPFRPEQQKSSQPPVKQSARQNPVEETTITDLRTTHPPAFIEKQKRKLEELRDTLLDQMADVAHDSLRAASEGGGGAAFGQHMGDAGSDAYERDFALSLLSQEQDSLYEINEALKRIELGTYGMCEKSGQEIPRSRLEAIPWARYTVACQAEMEKANARKNRWDSTPQFMDSIESDEESEEEESDEDSRNKTNKE